MPLIRSSIRPAITTPNRLEDVLISANVWSAPSLSISDDRVGKVSIILAAAEAETPGTMARTFCQRQAEERSVGVFLYFLRST